MSWHSSVIQEHYIGLSFLKRHREDPIQDANVRKIPINFCAYLVCSPVIEEPGTLLQANSKFSFVYIQVKEPKSLLCHGMKSKGFFLSLGQKYPKAPYARLSLQWNCTSYLFKLRIREDRGITPEASGCESLKQRLSAISRRLIQLIRRQRTLILHIHNVDMGFLGQCRSQIYYCIESFIWNRIKEKGTIHINS